MAPLLPTPAWDLLAGIDPSSLVPGVRLLLEARDCAFGLGRDGWDFAVELGQLRAAGLSHSILRVLVCRGYVRAAAEVAARNGERKFRRLSGLTLPDRACLVLTEQGEAGARLLAALPPPILDAPAHARPGRRRCRPRWDAALRELWFAGVLVKRFRRPAPNQERILAAFQEEGWPARIDDPLSPARGIDPARRLHDAIAALNRGQLRPLLRFRRDGSEQGGRWEHRHPIARRQFGECSHNRKGCSLCAPGPAGQPGAAGTSRRTGRPGNSYPRTYAMDCRHLAKMLLTKTVRLARRLRGGTGNATTPRRLRKPLRFVLEALEDRVVPDANSPLVAVGAAPDSAPWARVHEADTGVERFAVLAYDATFTGGVRTALADLNRDGVADLVTAPGPGGGPHVKVFDGRGGREVSGFMAADSGTRSGAQVGVVESRVGEPEVAAYVEEGLSWAVKRFGGDLGRGGSATRSGQFEPFVGLDGAGPPWPA